MNRFEYATPSSLDEAASLLGDRWGETEVLAGGTDLVTALKQGITNPKRLVSLNKIESLRNIGSDADTLRIGSTATLRSVADNASVAENFPAIVKAIRNIGSPQIINAGTIGGDLCQRPRCWYFRNGYGLLAHSGGKALVPAGDNRYHAVFDNEGPAYFVSASSLDPVLSALGASVVLQGKSDATRKVPVAEFFRKPASDTERETALKPSEIVTAVEIPLAGKRNSIYEIRHRHGFDWPYVAAAVAYRHEGGKAMQPKIVLGHVAPTPWQAKSAEGVLADSMVTEEIAEICGTSATAGANPLSGNGYKVQLVKTAVKRAILIAAGIMREA